MATARGSSRRQAAFAKKTAAKEQRQKYYVIGGAVLLVLLLAYEVPHTLKLLNKGSSSSPSSATAPLTPTATTPSTSPKVSAATKRLLKQAPHDVFAGKVSAVPTTLGSIATPPGLHDPFAETSSPGAAVAPVVAPPKPRVATLPGTIIVGTPGAGKTETQGWIVILASIPTEQGQSSATSFATQAGKAGVGAVKVLNSSNKKPLRGGFWVVYTGPFSSLAAVSTASAGIHAKGFTTAYIRQLVVYKAKPAAKKTKKTKK